MTRINASIPPEKLCDKHLIAEIHEITRIPTLIRAGKAKVEDIPDTFRLGPGHVKFFYNKLKYLHNRYNVLCNEAVKRDFKINSSYDWLGLPVELYNDYEPGRRDYTIVSARINIRLHNMKNLKYYGKPISIEDMKLPPY